MERKRFDEVDFAKAIGIVGVIAIHILTHNLTGPINKFFWNWSQFVVVAFVFCSGFVLTHAYKDKITTIKSTLLWYKKRLIRLIFPFYIYLIAHYLFWILFPQFFSGLGLSKSVEYFAKSALFIGGTNFNFLPLLFIQLTILFPLFINWSKRKKILYVYIFFALLITLVFTFAKFPYSLYRQTMWAPWSLVLILAVYFSSTKNYLKWAMLSFAGFLVLYFLNGFLGKGEIFYNHKYPPDFYYLLFGVSLTLFLLILGRSKVWQNETLKSIYYFISRNSYKIFFIHLLILDFALTMSGKHLVLQNAPIEFAIVFFPSIFFAYMFEKIQLKLKNR